VPEPPLAEALRAWKAALEEYGWMFTAMQVILEAVEACGGVAELTAALDAECEARRDELDLLTIEVATLRRERERRAG
jgi:hypothetical protein